MSALGQKQTYALQKAMSALPPIATAKADMEIEPLGLGFYKNFASGVSFVPARAILAPPLGPCRFAKDFRLRAPGIRRRGGKGLEDCSDNGHLPTSSAIGGAAIHGQITPEAGQANHCKSNSDAQTST